MQSPELEIDPDGVPRSKRFDDVYATRSGARAQALQVYLQGVGLPARWQGQQRHAILELGFGLGVNFLTTLQAWRACPERCAHLDYIAIEGFPIAGSDWQKLSVDSLDANYVADQAELAARWPDAEAGFHTLEFEQGRVRLILVFWDVLKALVEIEARVDSVYLDGFSPAKNPEMFSKPVLTAVRRLLKPDARLASYSVQGQFRADLESLGFEVQRLPGLGQKKERLSARLLHARRAFAAPTNQRIAVIGAGIVGLSLAHQLTQAGLSVQIFEQADAIGCGASGVPAALMHPPSGAHDSLEFGLQTHAFRAALRVLNALEAQGFNTGYQRIVIYEQRKSGRAKTHTQGGMIQPEALLHALIQSGDLQIQFNSTITKLRAHGEGHSIQVNENWQEFDAVILCNGMGAAGLLPINLRPVAGQVELIESTELPPLNRAHCGQANILPLRADLWCVGNSFERGEVAGTAKTSTRLALLANAAELLQQPHLLALESNCRSWVGTRVQTAERRPLIGLLKPGLYLNLAHASKGFMTGFLAAEIITDHLLARAHGAPARLLDAIAVG
jgi:tRNA 5-methylaminomethyl-2-thiouridine biosynthesis bifunctional protein